MTRLSRSFQQLVNGAGSSENARRRRTTGALQTPTCSCYHSVFYKKSSKWSTITHSSCVKPLHNSWSGSPSLGCSTWSHTISGREFMIWVIQSKMNTPQHFGTRTSRIFFRVAHEKKGCLLSRMHLFHFSQTADIKHKKGPRSEKKTYSELETPDDGHNSWNKENSWYMFCQWLN